MVQVLDFNPARNRRARQSLVSTPWPSALKLGQASSGERDLQATVEDSDFKVLGAFNDGDVMLGLPYVESWIGPFIHNGPGIIISDEHLMVFTGVCTFLSRLFHMD